MQANSNMIGQVLHSGPDIKIEYFDLVDPETIRPIHAVEGPLRVALAAWIGKTRLIDNVLCEPPRLPIERYKKRSENRQAPTKRVDHVSLQGAGHFDRN
ncbi:MAG: pantoate--beta-alanine ligase [Bryobacteraceae bacterium]|jgi:hypothetical protein